MRPAALLLVLGLAAVLAFRQVGSLDVGFHLKAGNHILAGQGWPRTDPFSFTMSDHAWIDTSWGYQVLVALVEGGAGAPGLVLLHAALVISTLTLLWRSARLAPHRPGVLVALLFLAAVAAEMRYEVRPELLSYLFLAGVLHILHRHAEGRAAPLMALPAIFLVWANCHALFILGWGALGCMAVGLLLRDRRLDRGLLLAGAGSLLAPFLTPYGLRGVLFPLTLATRMQEGNVFAESIGEFVSPFSLGLAEQFPFYPRLPILAFRLLGILAVVALIPLWRQRRFGCLLLIGAFLPLAAQMIRNVPILAVATLPGVIWGISALPSPGRSRSSRLLPALVCLACLILGLRVLTDAYYIASRRTERFGLGWNRLSLPLDTVDAVNRLGLGGPVLNHLNFGGWLMWARPDPVFIDGRLEVVGEEFYRQYLAILGNEPAREAAVARHGIRWIVFPYVTNPTLLGALSRDPRWRLSHVDHLGAVFTRAPAAGATAPAPEPPDPALLRAPAPVAWASLPGLGGEPRASRPSRWLAGLYRRQDFPTDDFNRGLFHLYRGELDAAEVRFSHAIAASDGAYYEAYNNLGAVLFRKGRLQEARQCYQIVLTDDPENRLARQRLAAVR